MRSRLLAAALAFLGAACTPAYVTPTRDDAARLLLIPEPDTGSQPYAFGFGDGKECRNKMNLVGSGALKARAETKVAPGEDFTVLGTFSDSTRTCSVAVTFVPRPRESYAALVGGSPARCKLTVARWDGKGFVPEPSARKRRWRLPFMSNAEAQCDVDAPASASPAPASPAPAPHAPALPRP